MTADRMASDTFELTQEFLAEMLAVPRPTVNDIAQSLADDAVITYRRGVITILDHDRLHATACDCYDVIREASRRAFDN